MQCLHSLKGWNANVTRSVKAPITDFPGDETAHRKEPAWTADGRHIAFQASNDAMSWIQAVDSQTGYEAYTSDPDTYDFSCGEDSVSFRFGSPVVRLA